MADKMTKNCMDMYRNLEKSRVLNTIERLQIPNILEICCLYNLQWKKYVKIYINPGIDLSVLKDGVLSAFQHHRAGCYNLPFIGFILIPIGANILRLKY
jgi:hypothetical protein